MSSKSGNEQPARQWYGTIGEEYVRQRDGVPTRKRSVTLSVQTISRLELYCAVPKQSTNLIIEQAITEFLDREEKRRERTTKRSG